MSAAQLENSKFSLDLDCSHLFGHEEAKADIFGAFSNEFIVGACASQVVKEKEAISPYTDRAYCFHSRSSSRLLAVDAAPSADVGMESSSHASTADCRRPRTRFKASPEIGAKSTSRAVGFRTREKAVAVAPGTPRDASAGNTILSFSSVRKISSTTYLRRLQLSRGEAAALFPASKEMMEFIFATDTTRCASPEQLKVETCVSLQDGEGRLWPAVLECLRSGGQRHVRLNKGWSEMCRANGISVGKRIRLALWEQVSSSSGTLVRKTVIVTIV